MPRFGVRVELLDDGGVVGGGRPLLLVLLSLGRNAVASHGRQEEHDDDQKHKEPEAERHAKPEDPRVGDRALVQFRADRRHVHFFPGFQHEHAVRGHQGPILGRLQQRVRGGLLQGAGLGHTAVLPAIDLLANPFAD